MSNNCVYRISYGKVNLPEATTHYCIVGKVKEVKENCDCPKMVELEKVIVEESEAYP